MKTKIKPTHIDFSDLFNQELKDAPREIKFSFRESLILFKEDQNHPALRNHALKKTFSGYKSIDVTEDWRALFKEKRTKTQKVIMFHRLGTHKQLYE